jgi:hypothetical protein
MTDTVIAITTTVMIIAIAEERARLGQLVAHEGILMVGIVTHAATNTVITTTMAASAIIVKEIVTVTVTVIVNVIVTEKEIGTETASETVIVIEEVQGGKIVPKGERNGVKLLVQLALEVQP